MSDDRGLDVLVIGGGVTGAGVALDAATRGLRVGVVDAQDWASGTSSRSSKLVHGGLRYLQMLDFKLVSEALGERGLLIDKLAPHLVRAVPFLYPLTKWYERPYVGAGIALYDALATFGTRNRAVPLHRHVSRRGVREVFPGIKADVCRGAVRYYDGQVDDARLVIALIRTAVQLGAYAASRTEVVELVKDDSGRVTGAVLRDLESGAEHLVRTRSVINATGVWTEQTQSLVTDGGLHVLASKGIHIVVPRERIAGTSGIILQTEKSVLFLIPWSRYWVIGTTDTAYHGDLTHPVASHADIDYVLDHANAILAHPLTRNDVVGTWAGLRPLLQPGTKGDEKSSTKVSREHTVTEAAPGLVSIAGGKLTTYRVMAEDAVDFALGEQRATELPSETATTPLVGAAGYHAYARRASEISRTYGWSDATVAHLLHRYGSALSELLDLVDARPDLGRPLAGAEAYLRAEIVYGVSHEGALHLEDTMTIRTRLTYEVGNHGLAAVTEIADLMAGQLGWDEARRQFELDAYQARCAAEDAAAAAPDDEAAQQARQRIGDVLADLPGAEVTTLA
ncbi:glycerol-3-phosphate dehydrogenase [Microlunatus phosphovorus NM-1]|uniref:Glycerol-3-phosphate dehydrogenase n=2 Tax=Microlunatus phosphovorus TaxID=29405 RepID=F5XRQ2_MICPN|nr:glycerol-3-phosphate dehydrogenase [Microlunatus phosphovorus NM-1]